MQQEHRRLLHQQISRRRRQRIRQTRTRRIRQNQRLRQPSDLLQLRARRRGARGLVFGEEIAEVGGVEEEMGSATAV